MKPRSSNPDSGADLKVHRASQYDFRYFPSFRGAGSLTQNPKPSTPSDILLRAAGMDEAITQLGHTLA